MADWELLLTDARIATMRHGAPDYGAIEAGAIAIAGGVIGLVLVASGVALRGGMARPEIKRVEVTLPRLPAALDGFTIAQLTDLHLGARLRAGAPKSGPVREALDVMARYKISGLPVVGPRGTLRGILTNRDLRFVDDTKLALGERVAALLARRLPVVHLAGLLSLARSRTSAGAASGHEAIATSVSGRGDRRTDMGGPVYGFS